MHGVSVSIVQSRQAVIRTRKQSQTNWQPVVQEDRHAGKQNLAYFRLVENVYLYYSIALMCHVDRLHVNSLNVITCNAMQPVHMCYYVLSA